MLMLPKLLLENAPPLEASVLATGDAAALVPALLPPPLFACAMPPNCSCSRRLWPL
jgi:hypothetical protein